METNLTPYDEVPYPSYTHPQTHPDRLAVVGRLYGLEPAQVERCRVLELGCGNGSNLVPMAWGLPRSEFVGIDLAGRPVAEGQRMAADLGLSNVRLCHGDLAQIDDQWGQFDYIIAHGLYSWVSSPVQDRLLAICRERLLSQGIVFVSYNALPGGHLRNMLGEMLRFHTRGFRSPQDQMNQALALARLLAEAQDTRDEYRLWMKAELDRILEHEEGHLFHDELATTNEATYFTQFVERAAGHHLQFLGEADFFEMSDQGLAEPVRQALRQLASNRILREQYLDFIKCRRFRQTLLCHRAVPLRMAPRPESVAGFLVASAAGSASGSIDLRPGVTSTFETPKGSKIQTDFALGKAALVRLGIVWPVPLRFDELSRECQAELEQAGIIEVTERQFEGRLCEFLLRLYEAGTVEFRTWLPPIVCAVSERPVASPVARWQARRRPFVTSLFHLAVKVEDEIGRSLLAWLDGSLDHGGLLERIEHLLVSRDAMIVAAGEETTVRRKLEQELEANLAKLARLGLLVA